MIINLRGTSGSGKSTIVRSMMDLYAVRQPVHIEKRKQPLYYRLWRTEDTTGKPDLIVLGHYEVACGGCDTLPTMDKVFELATTASTEATHVIFEGLLLGVDVTRTVELNRFSGGKLEVIFLNTNLDTCFASVNARRWAKDPTKPPVSTKNTESKYNALKSIVPRLVNGGVWAYETSRQGALERVADILFSDTEGAELL